MDVDPVRIQLAIGRIEIASSADWDRKFSDPEIEVSLHRWGWLLRGLTDDEVTLSRDQGIALMRSWLRCCLSRKALGQDAYSTSERIANACLFLLRSGDGDVPDDLRAALRFMGSQVAANLEYYEGDRTGNHAFNNARGLLFAGVIGELPEAVELAFEIVKERLPRLVTAHGYLREGSSHYHFLFTRWVLEVLWLAQYARLEKISECIRPSAARLVESCWFFLVKDISTGEWCIPLMGDISPDFPPGWLMGLPWCELATELYLPEVLPRLGKQVGWADLFGVREGQTLAPKYVTISSCQSEWHRVVRGDWMLFMRAGSDHGRVRADHGHCDLGSFVLFHAGKLVIGDLGRADYTGSPLSTYGKAAESHNTIFIDGLAPSVRGPSWFASAYCRVRVETEVFETDSSSIFVLRHTGFERLSGRVISHERKLVLQSGGLEIQDVLHGTIDCNVLLKFHWSPAIELLSTDRPDHFKLTPQGGFFHMDARLLPALTHGSEADPWGGTFCSEYGVADTCLSLSGSARLRFPVVIVNKLILGT